MMVVRRTGSMGVLLTNTMRTATLLILVTSKFEGVDCSTKPYGGVLQSTIAYSPLPPKPEYKSNATFNPLGMEHVYKITNTFLSIIQRKDMMPIGLNISMVARAISAGPESSLSFLSSHWQQLLLQHIGVLTALVFGLLLAGLLPLVGFFFCCCRCCCGRCGSQPSSPYDKRGDGCRRVSLGLLLSLFVIAALFGSVCSFVTNYYTYTGATKVTNRTKDSLDDAGLYLEHTNNTLHMLLVTNFEQLEEVVDSVLDNSGEIIVDKLNNLTGASAVGRLNAVVGGLENVRRTLREVGKDTKNLEIKRNQLKTGLAKSRSSLAEVLSHCADHHACRDFSRDYRLEEDLTLSPAFVGVSFTVANFGINNAVAELSDLLGGGLVAEVGRGQQALVEVEKTLSEAASAAAPEVRSALRQMGDELKERAMQIGATLASVPVAPALADLPKLDELTSKWVEYRYYLGLGMASVILLLLICFILGLFYGLCGRRPGGLYGDDCCNRGTGATLLATGCHLVFLFSFPILLLTALHFLFGATLQHGVCNTLRQPARSDVFNELDRAVLTPRLADVFNERPGDGRTALQVIQDCHSNQSLYNVLGLEKVYNISSLGSWRSTWGLSSPLLSLGSANNMGLEGVVLLPKNAEVDLQQLSKSPLASLNLSQFSSLGGEEVTVVDIQKLVRRLRTLREQVGRREEMRGVANDLELEVRYLDNMVTVGKELSLTARRLLDRLEQLDRDLGGEGQASLATSLPALIESAAKAEITLRSTGDSLVSGLVNQLATEAADLVDAYVRKVEIGVRREVGACAPLSEAFNATITAVCSEVVEPFNGFWASMGWCYLLYLPCILLSVSLIKLYRKTESYPGPVLEAEVQPLDGRPGKVKRRGHRRTASSMRLPEFTHSRALPALPPDEEGQAPPRYSSNPSIPMTEYERPPPYYFPNRGK